MSTSSVDGCAQVEADVGAEETGAAVRRVGIENFTLLEAMAAAVPAGFKLVDRQYRVLRINQWLAQVAGRTVAEATGLTLAELVPELWPQVEDAYRRAFEGETVVNLESTMHQGLGSGRVRHLMGSYYPVYLDDEIVGVGNVVVDITERKEAEQLTIRNLAAMVDAIALMVECRDPYTAGHQQRVAELSVLIAGEMGLDARVVEGIETAARMHDLGKISVPAEILSKPGPLSRAETDMIREHPETGYSILSDIAFPWPVAEMIRQHHERLDGSGYPRGLRGAEILLGARIIAVADVVEAMSAHRPYRGGLGIDVAIAQIEHDRGTLLDADAVAACCRLFRAGRLQKALASMAARTPPPRSPQGVVHLCGDDRKLRVADRLDPAGGTSRRGKPFIRRKEDSA